MVVPAEHDLISIHTLSGQLQVPSRRIEAELQAMGQPAAWRINNVLHLDGVQAEAVAHAIREGKA